MMNKNGLKQGAKVELPVSSELLQYMHQLRVMRQYFENHPYYDDYDGCDVINVLRTINDNVDVVP